MVVIACNLQCGVVSMPIYWCAQIHSLQRTRALCSGGCGGGRDSVYIYACWCMCVCVCVHVCACSLHSCIHSWVCGCGCTHGWVGGVACMCVFVFVLFLPLLCSSSSPSSEPYTVHTHWGSTHPPCVFTSRWGLLLWVTQCGTMQVYSVCVSVSACGCQYAHIHTFICILCVAPWFVLCWCLYTLNGGGLDVIKALCIGVCVCMCVFCMYCVYTYFGQLK